MRSTFVLAALVCLIAIVGVVAQEDECNGDDYGTAGQFDFYVLQQSWPAEFCSAHSEWPGCSSPTLWQQTNLTMHGLWPNYQTPQGSHDWPQCCTSTYGSTLDPDVLTDLLSQLQTYWPNEQDPSGSDPDSSLWAHEWGKHGTCSGLAQEDYFQRAMALEISMPTPAVITANIGGQANYTALMAAYNASDCEDGDDCIVGLTCDSGDNGQYLSGVTTCWTPDFAQISCPAEVFSDACDSTQNVLIQSFTAPEMKKRAQQMKKKIVMV